MSEEKPRAKHKTEKPILSAREIRFAQLCFEYGSRGRSKAYLEAGFPSKETTNDNESAACYLLRKSQLREYIRHLQDVACEAAKVTVEELAALVSAFAKSDLRKIMTRTGEFLPMDEWPDEVAIAVESIETEEIFEPVPGKRGKKRLKGYTRKVKLVGKMSAATRLMEWKRMIGQDKQAIDPAAKEEPYKAGGDAGDPLAPPT